MLEKKCKNMLFDPIPTPPGAPRGLFLRVEQPQKVGAKKYAGPKKAYFLVIPVLGDLQLCTIAATAAGVR